MASYAASYFKSVFSGHFSTVEVIMHEDVTPTWVCLPKQRARLTVWNLFYTVSAIVGWGLSCHCNSFRCLKCGNLFFVIHVIHFVQADVIFSYLKTQSCTLEEETNASRCPFPFLAYSRILLYEARKTTNENWSALCGSFVFHSMGSMQISPAPTTVCTGLSVLRATQE